MNSEDLLVALQIEAADLRSDLLMDLSISDAMDRACLLVVKQRREIDRLSAKILEIQNAKAKDV